MRWSGIGPLIRSAAHKFLKRSEVHRTPRERCRIVAFDPKRLFKQAFGCKHASRNLGSLRFDPGGLHDRPPFLGVRFLHGRE